MYCEVEEHETGTGRQRQIGPLHAHRERHGKLPGCQVGLIDSGLEQDEEKERSDDRDHGSQGRLECRHAADEKIEAEVADGRVTPALAAEQIAEMLR